MTKPSDSTIRKVGRYSLECKSFARSSLYVVSKESVSGSLSGGSESFALYVDGDLGEFTEAEYNIIQDDADYLVMIRHYLHSGLIETLVLNKKTGFLMDSKTVALGITGEYPKGDSYFFKCK